MRALKEFIRFCQLQEDMRRLVFYAEDSQSWVHFESIISDLTHDTQVCYLTSSPVDPVLTGSHPNILPFYIGHGAVRTAAFSLLKASVCVMTVPDLQTYQLKRSLVSKVHYCHVFHSMVSTHMTYREGAFDHFDSILCVGPHHEEEIRSWERSRGIPAKRLFQVGYARLDNLIKMADHRTSDPDPNHVLIAPSHGPFALIETCGVDLISVLLNDGFQVTVRPHPVTLKSTALINGLTEKFGGNARFHLERDVASKDSLFSSGVMVSDWSGVALEYAFGLQRPVLFIDVPRKVNNPHYEGVTVTPIEVSLRHQIGQLLPPGELDKIPAILKRWGEHVPRVRAQLASLRDRYVYNVGRSGEAGAAAIRQLLREREFSPRLEKQERVSAAG